MNIERRDVVAHNYGPIWSLNSCYNRNNNNFNKN